MSLPNSLQRRRQLVESLRENGAIQRDEIARAFVAVPREIFVQGRSLSDVYRDQAITTKEEAGVPVSSSSQPTMMAMMLEQLDVHPGMRVLEIGSGTGYNAALLQELVGQSGQVISLEIDPEIANWARDRLRDAGCGQVDVIETDGGNGWSAGAPYDRIELTVGTADIAPAWVDQFRPGGILVAPLWVNTVQLCVAFVIHDGRLTSLSALPCGFTRIRGRLAGADQYRTLQPGVMIATGSPDPVDSLIRQLIAEPRRTEVVEGHSWHGLVAYMALHDPSMLMIASHDERITGFKDAAFGLVDPSDRSLCVLTYPIAGIGTGTIFSYGGPVARARFDDLVHQWRATGSPDVSDINISAVPLGEAVPASHDMVVLETGRWRFVFRFGKRGDTDASGAGDRDRRPQGRGN